MCMPREVKNRHFAMLSTHSIGNQLYNTMVVFKMRDIVPSARYYSVCNVLCLWRIWLIPTYHKNEKKKFNEQRDRDAASKKELIQVE